MEFEKADYNKLEKIGVKSLLDLCLCIPKNYVNTRPISNPYDSQMGTLEVQILPYQWPATHSTRMLRIPAYTPSLDLQITLLIFHPKIYHKALFAPYKHLFVYGRIEHKHSVMSIIQPKIIPETNTLTPVFKIPQIRDKTMYNLIQKYITQENLAPLLPEHFISPILRIFYPDSEFLQHYEAKKSLPQESLEALKFIEIYQHISRLSKKRRYFESKFICRGDYQSFIKTLPFTLTPSQKKVLKDIELDLSNHTAARRVIMGDVGCGKTIVIFCSVMMAYPKKSILMVPTTVLAEQIFTEAKRLLPPSVKIGLISAQSYQGQEDADFFIGTQALLHHDFNPAEFALIMVDEQHRFGTNQRNALQALLANPDSKKPHFLQFSATPIPRTMGMIQSHLIDISVITDLPFKKDITTKIIHKNHFRELLEHLSQEIKQGRQSIIVYPIVQESEHINYLSLEKGAAFWKKYFRNVYITHGQDKNKELTLKEFRKSGDILLATTLIEVGISLPRLSTIVIIAPERLGLATLHQLRGRVSRNGLKGYCFLYTHRSNERLEEFSATLDGFKIAELDLKYRNSGDLLSGIRQSGDSFRFFDFDEKVLQEAEHFHSLHS